MEAERVCVVSVVVSRVLVVRRLCEGKVAVVIDVEKVAVPAAGLNGDYPATDLAALAVRVGDGGESKSLTTRCRSPGYVMSSGPFTTGRP